MIPLSLIFEDVPEKEEWEYGVLDTIQYCGKTVEGLLNTFATRKLSPRDPSFTADQELWEHKDEYNSQSEESKSSWEGSVTEMTSLNTAIEAQSSPEAHTRIEDAEHEALSGDDVGDDVGDV